MARVLQQVGLSILMGWLGCSALTFQSHLRPTGLSRSNPPMMGVLKALELDWTEATTADATTTTFSGSASVTDEALRSTPNPYIFNNATTSFSSVPAFATVAEAVVMQPGVLTPPPTRTSSAQKLRPRSSTAVVSRREWFQRAAVVALGGAVIGGSITRDENKKKRPSTLPKQQSMTPTTGALPQPPHSPSKKSTKHLKPLNMTEIAKETQVHVSVESLTGLVSIDTTTFQKKQALRLPDWFPSSLVPPPRVIKDIPDSELLIAAIVAGSTMDMIRTSLLYPILTLKNRIQNDIKTNKYPPARNSWLYLARRLKLVELNAQRHFQEGKLYRGIVPSLLKSAPATGVYYGARDVMKRALHSSFLPVHLSSVQISVVAALVADVLSLMVKTPADTLATRLQVAAVVQDPPLPTPATDGSDGGGGLDSDGNGGDVPGRSNLAAPVQPQVGSWFTDSLERLPAIVLTDLPYLLSRIAINQSLLNGNSIDIGRYEVMAVSTALVCAFLTTPFDVARTRILVDSDNDPTNGIDGGSGEGLIPTFERIMQEGEGGIRNLFAGWLERTLYLGIGRAWIEPFQIVGYMVLRDIILLEWFD